jgi:hypothetical protein
MQRPKGHELAKMTSQLLGPLSAVRNGGAIDSKQAAQFEAIGFGLDTVHAVYCRLASALRDDRSDLELVFADAWAIIDWMNRLDRLVAGCRGLRKKEADVIGFRNTSSLVENLRHLFQHPEQELGSMAISGRSLWGHLAWQRLAGGGHEVMVVTPFGRFAGDDYRLPSDHDQPPRAFVDRISLFSPDGAIEIGLTGQHESVVRFAAQLDAAIHVASERSAPGEILRLTTWLPGAGQDMSQAFCP